MTRVPVVGSYIRDNVTAKYIADVSLEQARDMVSHHLQIVAEAVDNTGHILINKYYAKLTSVGDYDMVLYNHDGNYRLYTIEAASAEFDDLGVKKAARGLQADG